MTDEELYWRLQSLLAGMERQSQDNAELEPLTRDARALYEALQERVPAPKLTENQRVTCPNNLGLGSNMAYFTEGKEGSVMGFTETGVVRVWWPVGGEVRHFPRELKPA